MSPGNCHLRDGVEERGRGEEGCVGRLEVRSRMGKEKEEKARNDQKL